MPVPSKTVPVPSEAVPDSDSLTDRAIGRLAWPLSDNCGMPAGTGTGTAALGTEATHEMCSKESFRSVWSFLGVTQCQ